MRVLLIEDDPSLGMFYSRALKRAGYEVSVESRGDDGLKAAQHQAPDLLVVDWFLPGIDGITILQRLRGGGYEGPILMLSGSGDMAREEARSGSEFLSGQTLRTRGFDQLRRHAHQPLAG